ncbi:MAG: carboxypeptidase regulatory-like domain-containing protein [Terriglobales bacterium]|jgi:hypothetical protein
MRWTLRPILAFAVVFSIFSLRTGAQVTEGTVIGTVFDAQGARVAQATITVMAVDIGSSRTATSNGVGDFQVPSLAPGHYHVHVDAKGFGPAEADIRVFVGTNPKLDFKLPPARVGETVTVTGASSSITLDPLDLSSTTLKATVDRTDLVELPLAARSFANISYLAPGTEPVEPSDPTKARITAVSTGGSSGLNNELSVDGADNSDDYIGGFLQNFSPDAIQEFAFRTTRQEADTGRTTAGSVVITTRRGTNDWHGEAGFYDREAALNARFPIENPAPNPKQPFSRQNYVGSLGGPIKKDKVFFFSNFEYVHEDASIAYSDSSQAQLNALATLAADGVVPGVSSITLPTSVPVPFRDYLGMARLDWLQSEHSQWFLRGAIDSYITHNALVEQGALPSTGATQHNNYVNVVLSEMYEFSPTWVGKFLIDYGELHLTETRNSDLGFALAFPFTTTNIVNSGFETYGDNNFITPISAFPVLRNQEKYQFRYDVTHASGKHSPSFGVNFIHEPVLSGALTGTAETLIQYGSNPLAYLQQYQANPLSVDLSCGGSTVTCTQTPAGDGSFSQNVQRLGFYAEDSWRMTPRFLVNYGVRYDTTFGLFTADGRSLSQNPVLLYLQSQNINLVNGAPHDYRGAVAPRLGFAYSLGRTDSTVLRGGFGMFYNDLAQNGWVSAFQEVNDTNVLQAVPAERGTAPSCPPSGSPFCGLIDSNYKTPYNMHFTAGVQQRFNAKWAMTADYVHEEGVHGYRAYTYVPGYTLPASVPFPVNVFRSDNRSSYNGLLFHLQGNMTKRFSLVANYTFSKAQTWGCTLAELFDYVNGVCNPLNAFAPGDYGPSGEDVRHRFVLAGILHLPVGFEITSIFQAESARPFTLTTSADVNNDGLGTCPPTVPPCTGMGEARAVVNGVPTTLDEFRGTPYIQMDMRVARPFKIKDRFTALPFIEFFNLFNRNNPGAFYVTDIEDIGPYGVNNPANATAICLNASCSLSQPITSLNQLRIPNGALGDYFGPGTTVGIPFAAQLGVRISF